MPAMVLCRACGHMFLIPCEYVCACVHVCAVGLCRCLDRISLHWILLRVCAQVHVDEVITYICKFVHIQGGTCTQGKMLGVFLHSLVGQHLIHCEVLMRY